ncbi:hypothetical protein HETIRDRAFT_418395 [Heterobasidion irregulare TC 32-1]|uniref:Uncharacterized protein n=1 Tax=Heterobasidion irregulare (strain TC 32-1) TaxID=747525 RepID=W4K3I6_HETIT|nr:uncharacterized protein HETIRDRAFT_418395 [Heterobasidion irregulare TC 32-1]ETW80372.1 hypothetical protein HETIRDRAFT_418395 [Heterobasidion irregulare TC 32-1]
MVNNLDAELEKHARERYDAIQRAHDDALVEWTVGKKAAMDAISKIESGLKELFADGEQRVMKISKEAAEELSKERKELERKMSEKRKEYDDMLKKCQKQLEDELELKQSTRLNDVMEKQRAVEDERRAAKEKGENERKHIADSLKAKRRELHARIQSAESTARIKWEGQVEATVKAAAEEKMKQEQRMLAQQRDADGNMRLRERECRGRSKREEDRHQAAEHKRQRESAQEKARAHIIEAWTTYKARWKKIESEPQGKPLPSSDIPWPTLKKPMHSLDITIGSMRELIMSPYHSTGETIEARLYSERSRWNEDSFASILSKVDEADRQSVKLGANLVRKLLKELSKESEGSPSVGANTTDSLGSLGLDSY